MKQLQEMLKPYFTEGQTDYDITAVLKYLKSKKIRLLKFDGEDFIYRSKEADFLIQGKPLHLYSEQEEIDLLKLLKTLTK